MKFLTRIAILFYVTMVMFLSAFTLLYVFNYINAQSVLEFFTLIYVDDNLRVIFAAIAGSLLFLNYVFFRAFSVTSHRGGIIAFDNPAGRVSVSLLALEELTKRVISKSPEVKEVKSKIMATKKGLFIKITLILRIEGSIPEITSRVQELVKRKIQDAIGLDEPIDVAIFVGKIIPDHGKEKRAAKKEEPPKEEEQNVPFQGYRA